MAKGGARVGAGRKRGIPNKVTKKRAEIAVAALEGGMTPLEILLQAMRDAFQMGGAMAAASFAKEAAPYVHPKLATISADIKQDLTIELATFARADS